MIIQKIISCTFVLMMVLLLVCISGCEKMPTIRDTPNTESVYFGDPIPIGVICISDGGKMRSRMGLPMRAWF